MTNGGLPILYMHAGSTNSVGYRKKKEEDMKLGCFTAGLGGGK